MPSDFHQVINTEKYKKITPNDGSFTPSKEIWVKDNTIWKEPKEIWVKDGATWKKVTTVANFVQGSTTAAASSTDSSVWSMYVDGGATQSIYNFGFVLTTTGVRQTLFSYGTTTETNFFEIYIDTSNRVVASSRFNSGTIATRTHASTLSANTAYYCSVKTRSGSNPKVTIDVTTIDGTAVGSQLTNNTFPAYSPGTTIPRYLFRRFTTTQYNFRGILFYVYIYGATYASSANKTTFESGSFLSGSTRSSSTITNTATGDYGEDVNFTLSNVTVDGTG